jgi:hypothetical protein
MSAWLKRFMASGLREGVGERPFLAFFRHSRERETSAKEVCRLIFDDGVNLEAGSG